LPRQLASSQAGTRCRSGRIVLRMDVRRLAHCTISTPRDPSHYSHHASSRQKTEDRCRCPGPNFLNSTLPDTHFALERQVQFILEKRNWLYFRYCPVSIAEKNCAWCQERLPKAGFACVCGRGA